MISIIVPIYNSEAYLQSCIASLQQQGDVQIILVDDGSTDTSLAIAQRYARQDDRIVVLSQVHAGQSTARNTGLQHAKGELIAFVDADDSLAADWCERHLAAIDGVDYVQSGYVRVEGSGYGIQKLPKNRYQFTSPCMRLYRREAIEGMRFEPGMIYEDVVWSVDLWQRDLRCRMIHYTGYHYTLNPHSTTSRPHLEEQAYVMKVLRQRGKNATLRVKMIIAYTLLRLKTHYLLQ